MKHGFFSGWPESVFHPCLIRGSMTFSFVSARRLSPNTLSPNTPGPNTPDPNTKTAAWFSGIESHAASGVLPVRIWPVRIWPVRIWR